MLRNLKKLLPEIEILVLVFVLAGCTSSLDIRQPLFTISEPVYMSHEENSACAFGGVYFDFYNKSASDVVYLETRMNVYDGESGKAAFAGQGTIITGSECLVESGLGHNFCISLDPYISRITETGYIIDQFYISRVDYSDGKVWKDEFGLYAITGRRK